MTGLNAPAFGADGNLEFTGVVPLLPLYRQWDVKRMVADLNGATQVAVNPNVVACSLDGESALLDLENSRYYQLNAVGTHIWTALESPKSVGELQAVVTEAFDVDSDRCARDVDALLGTLLRAGLVVVSDVQTT